MNPPVPRMTLNLAAIWTLLPGDQVYKTSARFATLPLQITASALLLHSALALSDETSGNVNSRLDLLFGTLGHCRRPGQ